MQAQWTRALALGVLTARLVGDIHKSQMTWRSWFTSLFGRIDYDRLAETAADLNREWAQLEEANSLLEQECEHGPVLPEVRFINAIGAVTAAGREFTESAHDCQSTFANTVRTAGRITLDECREFAIRMDSTYTELVHALREAHSVGSLFGIKSF